MELKKEMKMKHFGFFLLENILHIALPWKQKNSEDIECMVEKQTKPFVRTCTDCVSV